MFKKLMMKVLMGRQLKNLPKETRDHILSLVDQNPKFFEAMAKKIEARVKKGEDRMFATQAVAREHQGELQKMLSGR